MIDQRREIKKNSESCILTWKNRLNSKYCRVLCWRVPLYQKHRWKWNNDNHYHVVIYQKWSSTVVLVKPHVTLTSETTLSGGKCFRATMLHSMYVSISRHRNCVSCSITGLSFSKITKSKKSVTMIVNNICYCFSVNCCLAD